MRFEDLILFRRQQSPIFLHVQLIHNSKWLFDETDKPYFYSYRNETKNSQKSQNSK
jgi:hypothetical protein